MPEHPHRRRSDESRVKSLSEFIADYRSILYPLTLAALWLGLRFSTPGQRLDAVERIQRVDQELQRVDHENVTVLVKLQCFNPTFTDTQRAMAGLEGCNAIRQGLPDPHLAQREEKP